MDYLSTIQQEKNSDDVESYPFNSEGNIGVSERNLDVSEENAYDSETNIDDYGRNASESIGNQGNF